MLIFSFCVSLFRYFNPLLPPPFPPAWSIPPSGVLVLPFLFLLFLLFLLASEREKIMTRAHAATPRLLSLLYCDGTGADVVLPVGRWAALLGSQAR